jgi:hypothetical protein
MERIRIPNDATYSPLPLLEMALVAPLLSRVLLRATLPGRVLQMAALGVYAHSAVQDWLERRGVRKIDFLAEYGADVRNLVEMTEEQRWEEIHQLAGLINDEYVTTTRTRAEIAVECDRHLTNYIASVTGQHVETSTEIRSFGVAGVIFPFALGACDFISGEVAIFRDTGVFEPHVIAHEFAHRKGYWKELEAQALAYLALASSGDPYLVQSSRCERLHRHLRALAGDDPEAFVPLVARAGLRPEIEADYLAMRPAPSGPVAEKVEAVIKKIYEERMRITGQNGIRDYDVGFTNFLYTFARSGTARQDSPGVAGFG